MTTEDTYTCADCGREFTSGEERDDHFMSDDCPEQGRYDEEGTLKKSVN